jgi:pimeloyl-ACP methyl ester carboxylesterase
VRYAVLATCLLLSGIRAEDRTFDSGGVKIAYLDEGKGEVVVLLHGFGGSVPETRTHSPFAEAQFLPALKEYRVLAIDHRGHGKSDKLHDAQKYGKEMAEDVARLLDHEKVKKAHVVGYSMGSFVAGKLLDSHPDRLLTRRPGPVVRSLLTIRTIGEWSHSRGSARPTPQ